ncbi:OmpA family protein [Azospirillum sp. ST 5-10]|uniref:OmpA family protein n=1 Tax=unclassified Azospirillum TaxID=2630922 RepID=UPI003F49D320
MDRRRTGATAARGVVLAALLAAPAAAQPATMLGGNPSECDIAHALLGAAPPGCPPAPATVRPAPPPRAADAAAGPEAAPPPPTPSPARSALPQSAPLHPAPPHPAPLVTAPATAPEPPREGQRRAAFLIAFDFASARIRPESQAVLDRVAAVMASPEGRDRVFQVIGHTDAVGPAAANLNLSRRRAEAVVAYLTGRHGVASDRLEASGRGEEELADPAHPAAAANRRVEIAARRR